MTKPNDDYIPQIGDIIQYVGKSNEIAGAIGVIFKAEMLHTGYSSRRRRVMMYHIQFPTQKMILKPRHFKVIKKCEKNT